MPFPSHLKPISVDSPRSCRVADNDAPTRELSRSSSTVTLGALENGFYVEDDGAGFSADATDDVFQAGYSGRTDGTGLGLNIVEQIVDAHGWQIAAQDGTEGGARFEITGVEFVDE